jgi:glycosyltransferase involved in cell wall biosynthesis
MSTRQRRIHFIANCVYGNHLAGGDIHFFEMARAAAEAGYKVNFFGGYALASHIEAQKLDASQTFTEKEQKADINLGSLRGQISLFLDYFKRYRGTVREYAAIGREDVVYATTDYWFDVLPAVHSPARRKMMIWHMQAPRFKQIITRGRADVDAARIASAHYWASQNVSLASFRGAPIKRLLYVHPNMRQRLINRGYDEKEIRYVSFGVDRVSDGTIVPKSYDIVWIGRLHRQKGIDDLLQTLSFLARKVPQFRAVIVGKVKEDLQPIIEKMGLKGAVEFSGFVSEEEKFRLFRASRVYLMPSRFEGSPRVVGEALVCGLPVVAYDVETYRPIFGEFLRYVPCFDVGRFGLEAEQQILKVRAGENYLDKLDLSRFVQECSWETARWTFLEALREIAPPEVGIAQTEVS